jgi:protein-disulfide isomerase
MDIRRELLPNIFTGILVICAVIVTTLTVHQYLSNKSSASQSSRHIDGWERLLVGRVASLGGDSAKVKIIEFSDYQCPYCRELEKNLRELVSQSGVDVSIVRYDYPLTQIHIYAYKAAVASRCAERQGVYEPYQSELFSADLAVADWVGLAQKAGVPDISKFSDCVNKNQTASLIDADIKSADQFGIKQTPTLVINGNVVPGMESVQSLKNLVSRGD